MNSRLKAIKKKIKPPKCFIPPLVLLSREKGEYRIIGTDKLLSYEDIADKKAIVITRGVL
jgi:hypothetical protein